VSISHADKHTLTFEGYTSTFTVVYLFGNLGLGEINHVDGLQWAQLKTKKLLKHWKTTREKEAKDEERVRGCNSSARPCKFVSSTFPSTVYLPCLFHYLVLVISTLDYAA
jgi:hypothetical protein